MEQALLIQNMIDQFFDDIKKYLHLTENLNNLDEYQKCNDIDLKLYNFFLN